MSNPENILNRMKRIAAFALALIAANQAFASNPPADFNTRFTEANKLMEERLWNQSITIWQELVSQDNMNANVNYKLGYCYLQTVYDKTKALEYMKAACAMKFAKNYDPYDATQRKAPVDAMFYLGRAYHLNYELDNAIQTYNDLKKKLSKKHQLQPQIDRQIQDCEEAKRQIISPKNYIITNVGPVINTQYNDFCPVLSIDESAMFYTSKRPRTGNDSLALGSNEYFYDFDTGERKEDIYVSYKDREGNWMTPEALNLNSDEHDASISVAPDGQTLFIYRDSNDGNSGQIYQSKLVGETWSDPVLLGSDINTKFWETHATISSDGNTLYFVSNREGGYGGRDIYKCVKLPNGEWSRALNAGPGLNTPWEEDSPFLTPDGMTLYFASQGHSSMGGFDIFYCTLGADGEWGSPVNMGYPLNTVDDDVFFVPMADGRRAYYSSQKDGGYGLKDIYLVELPEVANESKLAVLKGFIIGEQGKELPSDLRILVTNNKTGEVTEYRPRMRDGGFVAILQPCNGYHIEYIKGKEIFHEDYINVPCESSYQEIEKEVYLMPVNLGPIAPPVVEKPKEEPKKEEPKKFDFDPAHPVNVIADDAQAHFSRYFVYDAGEYGVQEEKFIEFIKGVKRIVEVKGKATILVESSASNVPSSRFKNNQELTAYRNKTATEQVVQELTKLGLVKGKDYVFAEPRKLVQGKKYENDAQKNIRLYEEWQYIKIWAE